MKAYSIRRRLTAFLLGSLLLVWIGMLGWSYLEAREEVDELSDERLEETVRMLMLFDFRHLDVRAEYLNDHHDDQEKRIPFQVWSDDGRLLAHTPGVPDVPFDRRDSHGSFRIAKEVWYSYSAHDPQRGYQVRAFERSRVRNQVANKLGWRMMQVLLLTLPVMALLMWVSIGRGLKPLTRISSAIGMRNAANLEPIDLERVPSEAQPLVDSLNSLLKRLSHSLDRERAFTADAAHELRTPLAAIKVQAEVALGARDEVQRTHAMSQVIAGVNRATRLVQQLLLLARLDHPDSAAPEQVDLGRLASECAAHYADEAMRRNIELAVSAQANGIMQADPAALSIMIGNLIDNAIKYGKPGGDVAVRVEVGDRGLALSVKDDGPGVPRERYARLTDRFFRMGESDVEGSGLGLSIVAKIAETYRAEISLGEGLDGHGLGVTVLFPGSGCR